MAAARLARTPAPKIPDVAHRVYAHGDAQHQHESANRAPAATAALELSTAHPLQLFELRAVPGAVSNTGRRVKGARSPAVVDNPGGHFERVIALYQAGAEVPIT